MGDNNEWAARRLAIIQRNLEMLPDRYNAMREQFPGWRDQRLLTIAAIEEFQSKLDYVFQNACIASGASSAVSLAGTISSIVGAVMSWKGIPSSTSWVSAGSTLSAAGNIAVPVVSLIEYGFSHSYMGQSQEYLDTDQQFSRPLLEFLEYSRNLDEVVQEVFGCSIYSNIWQDVVAFWEESADIAQNTIRDTANIMDMLRRRMGGKIPEDILEEIADAFRRNFGRGMRSSGRGCMKTLQRLTELVHVPHVSMVISSVRIYAHANGILKGNLEASPINRIEWGKTDGWSITGNLLMEAGNIFLDITNLMRCRDGFIDGKSNYSRRLEEIKRGLTRELSAVENVILLNRLDRNR